MYFWQLLELTSINALLALGAYLPLAGGRIAVCFGAFMATGGITAGLIHTDFEAPIIVAVLLAGLFCGLLGWILSVVLASLAGMQFALATLAVGEMLRVFAVNSDLAGGALGYRAFDAIAPPGLAIAGLIPVIVAFVLFERSLPRRQVAVIRDDEDLAYALGIKVQRIRASLMAGGAFCAGVAGALYLRAVGILEPALFGFENSLKILLFAIIGGFMVSWGPMVGAAILTVLPELLRFSAGARMVLYGILLITVITIRPEGFWPKKMAGLTNPSRIQRRLGVFGKL